MLQVFKKGNEHAVGGQPLHLCRPPPRASRDIAPAVLSHLHHPIFSRVFPISILLTSYKNSLLSPLPPPFSLNKKLLPVICSAYTTTLTFCIYF